MGSSFAAEIAGALDLGSNLLLILKILHDTSILWYHNFQGIRSLGSCRNFSIHHSILNGSSGAKSMFSLATLLEKNHNIIPSH